jgi:4-amino-4-deoxy-L-arabinose transferase-like glycosyltransferase
MRKDCQPVKQWISSKFNIQRFRIASGYRGAILLFLIMGLSLLSGVLTALWIPGLVDDGIFLYQMRQVLDGAIPLREVYAPYPAYLWLGVPFLKIFGYNLFAGRMLSIFWSVISIPFIYLIGKELYSRRVGLIASAVFALSPITLIYYSSATYRPVAFSLLTIAMYLLILGLKRGNWLYYCLFGVILGFDIWVYRGVALFALGSPLLVLYFQRFNLRAAVKSIAFMAAGGMLAGGLIFYYLVRNSSLEFINYVWGFGASPVSGSIVGFASEQHPEWSIIQRFSSWDNFSSYFNFHSRVLYVMTRDWLYLIVPSLIFIALVLKEKLSHYKRRFWIILSSLTFIYVVIIARGQVLGPKGPYGTFEVGFAYQAMLFSGFAALLLLGIAVIAGNVKTDYRSKFAHSFLIFWLMIAIFTLFLFAIVHTHYTVYIAGVSSLMTAVVVDRALAGIKQQSREASRLHFWATPYVLFIAAFLFSLAATGYSFTTAISQRWADEWQVSQSDIREVGQYIRDRTSEVDEILTGYLLLAVASGRRNVLDISYVYLYQAGLNVPVPEEIDRFNAAPTIEEIVQHLASGKVKYVVLGNELRTDPQGYALIRGNTQISAYVDLLYEKEVSIGGFTLFRLSDTAPRGNFWDLAVNLPVITAFSEKESYVFDNGAWWENPGVQKIRRTNLQEGHQVGGVSKVNQILFHPAADGKASFIKFQILNNKYTSLSTSYGIADAAASMTEGVIYDVKVSTDGGNTYAGLLSTRVIENTWEETTIDLTDYLGKDLTFLLSSTGTNSGYYWLQITFRLTQPR